MLTKTKNAEGRLRLVNMGWGYQYLPYWTNIIKYWQNIDEYCKFLTKTHLFQKGMAKQNKKKSLRPTATRKQLLGLPKHIKML